MKIHLIKSKYLDNELYTSVITLLQAIPGPINFSFENNSIIDFEKEELFGNIVENETDFNTARDTFVCNLMEPKKFPLERETSSWETLFKKCTAFRRSNGIPENEFVFLLTETPNENNWFAAIDEKMPFNGFIHAHDWTYFIDCPEQFPIAYEVIALLLHHYTFKNVSEMSAEVHKRSIGCVNDFCSNKQDVILKLRTADICRSCMSKLKDRLSMPIIHHAMNLLESLRVKMLYAQNFKQDVPLSDLLFDARAKIFLTGFENIEIKLTPLEKSLYLLFLKYPEGIYLSSLSEHRNELYEIYAGIANMGDLHEMQLRIDDMVNALSDSASQKISKIKKAFENAIGEELAKNYYIKGGKGDVKKISLERSLVRLALQD